MRKIIVTYGLLAGLIVSLLMVINFSITQPCTGDYAMSMLIGYAGMIVALSMVFFGIRSYRDNYSGGSVTFGRAFLVGLCITLIASIMYVVCWKIYSAIAMPDFADQYAKHTIDQLKKSGASDSVIVVKTKEMAEIKEMFKNPVYEFVMTFIEIFPVGVLVSLICATILKRKPKPQV